VDLACQRRIGKMAMKRDESSSGELEACVCQQPLSSQSSLGGPAHSSSYDNLILANYRVMIVSFSGTRERWTKGYRRLDSDVMRKGCPPRNPQDKSNSWSNTRTEK
jgi:hypothetical protein